MSELRRSMSHPTRRGFLASAAAFLPAVYLYGCAGVGNRSGLFTLGVASGEPRPDSVVLWTRLAPDPLNGGGMSSAPIEVAWTVASDESFTRIVRRGTTMAMPADAHSVHVGVAGLEPGRTYWYRFIAGGEASPIGRTRTAPAAGARLDRFRFAYASCQQYEQGYYAAHRHMAAEDLDVVFFLGDYIYEASWGKNLIRHHGSGAAQTLADYRDRYALYKSDPDLQASQAAFPWIVTWDDHEVSNNYADDAGEHMIGTAFLARRAAAYKAYWEHMPLSPSMRPSGPRAQIYRAFDFGALARFAIIDDRQYRSHEACRKPGFVGGGGTFLEKSCPRRLDPHRTMLGATQERWLQDTIDRSNARWNALAQQTRMAQFEVLSDGERSVSLDGWDGYPAARQRLLRFIGARKPSNPLVIGGDVHATYVGNLKPDFDDPASPVVAAELCGTSITSYGPANRQAMARHLRQNPHMLYGNGWTRGYMRMTLDRRRAVAELRGLADAQDRDSAITTMAKFAVESGQPGVMPV